MDSLQKTFNAFIESTCAQYGCPDMVAPLQEGFSALCEAGEHMIGSVWNTVEWIHVYHAADPSMDMDIKLDSLWSTRQKDSATREDVINRFVEDAENFNQWLAASEDGGACITSAAVKFKGDQDAITVDIPCPGGEGLSTALSTGYDACCESVEQSDKKRNTDMAERLVEKAIRYLIDNKNYYVSAHDTHRYIESDGWFELEFELRGGSDPNTSVYLITHNDHDQDFEDEWTNGASDEEYGYDAIMWDPYTLHDYAYALENIIECDATRNDLPHEMVAEIVPFLQGAGYLTDFGKPKDAPAYESIGDTVRGLCEAVSVQDNAENWETCESMIKRVLEYLTWNKYYAVKGHYGHRNLSSDGWFEIEYNLVDRADPNTSVYLTTYCSSDPSLEQEWYGAGECPVEPNQIEWGTYGNDYHNMAYALENIIECDATRNDLPPEMVAEIVPFLKGIGYLENVGTPSDTPAYESIGDTVRGLFGKKKKPDDGEPQDEFFIRPYGGNIHQKNRYPGLIWSILGSINCDHGGRITKEQALGYIKRLVPAIRENPDMPAFEKTLYRVVEAIG